MRRKSRIAVLISAFVIVIAAGFVKYLSIEAENNEEEIIPSFYIWRLALATRMISANGSHDGVPLIIGIMDEDRHPIESTQALLDYGADINRQGPAGHDPTHPGGWTTLMVAADWHRLRATEFLLEKGAAPNIERDDGSTALFLLSPVYKDDLKIAERLIAAGADPCHRDKQGRFPWHNLDEGNALRIFIEGRCRMKGER